MSGQKWPACDMETAAFIAAVVHAVKGELGDKLDCICLHGSLALGSYYPPKSDIDILVFIPAPLTTGEMRALHKALLQLDDHRPYTGQLELSVILSEKVQVLPSYPVTHELHFGDNLTEEIREDRYDYAQARGPDPDLGAHLMVAKNRGIAVYGRNPADQIGPLSWQHYCEAVMDDLNWILESKHILETPFYAVLNCCRVMEMLETGEGTISSKEEGALWALENLPAEHHDIIHAALDCYRSAAPVTPAQRQRGGRKWDESGLLAFRDFVREHTNSPHIISE